MDNPFRYGRVATGEYFVGRDRELRELEMDIRAGQDVVIISPRRYGKSSLVLQALEQLRHQQVLAAYLDLFRTPTKESLARGLATALYAGLVDAKGRALHRIGEFFGRVSLRPTVTINPETQSFEISPGERAQDLDSTLERLLALPQKVAEDRQQRVVLVLDEFQQATEIDPHLPALMRAEFQTHQDVAHVFAGSQRHMMERLFTSTNEPMFRMAKPVRLGPIDAASFTAYIHRRFAATNSQITAEAIAHILEITGGHPANTQELCYFVWNLAAAEGATATPVLVDTAMDNVVEAEDARFTEIWRRLSANQRLVLGALVATKGAPAVHSEAYRRAHDLGPSSTVHRSISALRAADLVETTKTGEHRVADPLLHAWIARMIRGGSTIE